MSDIESAVKQYNANLPVRKRSTNKKRPSSLAAADGSGKCEHDPYWSGIYGTCMACRAEKAEIKSSFYEGALIGLKYRVDDACRATIEKVLKRHSQNDKIRDGAPETPPAT